MVRRRLSWWLLTKKTRDLRLVRVNSVAVIVKKLRLLLVLLSLVSFLQSVSIAGEPLAVFGEWYFFKYISTEKKLLCYIMTVPKSRYDNFNKRGQSFFTIIQEKDLNYQEVYLSFGIDYAKGIVDAEIDISKRKFPIFSFQDKAWAYNKTDDQEIINFIKKTLFFSVVVSYENNKNLMDVYSTSGFAEAFDYLVENCR
jgi:hypothetical protein